MLDSVLEKNRSYLQNTDSEVYDALIGEEKRQKNQIYEVIHNDKKYKYTYKRNFHGFRGDEITPSSIKIIS